MLRNVARGCARALARREMDAVDKMKFWLLTPLCLIGLAGCATQPPLNFHYEINPSILAQGSPQPTGDAIHSSPEMASNPEVKIRAQEATGYDQLSPEIKELYGPSPLELSLPEVVQEAIANNREIKIQGYSMQIAEYEIPVSKSIYDLMLGASGSLGSQKVQSTRAPTVVTVPTGGGSGGDFLSSFAVAVPVNETRTRNAAGDATQLLPTGATLQYAYTYSRTNAAPSFGNLNPLFRQAMTLSLSQPLLQGMGPKVTNADIHIAQLGFRGSAANFETQVQDQLRASLDAYWNLIFAVRSYDVQVVSYLAALDLLRINDAKEKAGVVARTEVLQAKASAEQRRENVIRARQAVRNNEDILKRLIHLQPGAPKWGTEIRPSQDLTWRELEIDAEKVLADAMAERPELRASETKVRVTDLQILKAKDAVKPQLDLKGSAGLTGSSDNSSQAYDDLSTADYNNYSIGLEFSFPLQNRKARFQLRQRQTEKLSAEEQLEQLKDTVTFDVRESVRELKTSREQIDIALERVKSEEANLEAQRKRLDVGVSTSFEVLQFQQDLARAQEAYIKAIVDYNKAQVAIERSRGTILRTYGVVVESPDLRPEDQPVIFPVGMN